MSEDVSTLEKKLVQDENSYRKTIKTKFKTNVSIDDWLSAIKNKHSHLILGYIRDNQNLTQPMGPSLFQGIPWIPGTLDISSHLLFHCDLKFKEKLGITDEFMKQVNFIKMVGHVFGLNAFIPAVTELEGEKLVYPVQSEGCGPCFQTEIFSKLAETVQHYKASLGKSNEETVKILETIYEAYQAGIALSQEFNQGFSQFSKLECDLTASEHNKLLNPLAEKLYERYNAGKMVIFISGYTRHAVGIMAHRGTLLICDRSGAVSPDVQKYQIKSIETDFLKKLAFFYKTKFKNSDDFYKQITSMGLKDDKSLTVPSKPQKYGNCGLANSKSLLKGILKHLNCPGFLMHYKKITFHLRENMIQSLQEKMLGCHARDRETYYSLIKEILKNNLNPDCENLSKKVRILKLLNMVSEPKTLCLVMRDELESELQARASQGMMVHRFNCGIAKKTITINEEKEMCDKLQSGIAEILNLCAPIQNLSENPNFIKAREFVKKHGESALFKVAQGNEDNVELLLYVGMLQTTALDMVHYINRKRLSGKTAIDYAVERGHTKIVATLKYLLTEYGEKQAPSEEEKSEVSLGSKP